MNVKWKFLYLFNQYFSFFIFLFLISSLSTLIYLRINKNKEYYDTFNKFITFIDKNKSNNYLNQFLLKNFVFYKIWNKYWKFYTIEPKNFTSFDFYVYKNFLIDEFKKSINTNKYELIKITEIIKKMDFTALDVILMKIINQSLIKKLFILQKFDTKYLSYWWNIKNKYYYICTLKNNCYLFNNNKKWNKNKIFVNFSLKWWQIKFFKNFYIKNKDWKYIIKKINKSLIKRYYKNINIKYNYKNSISKVFLTKLFIYWYKNKMFNFFYIDKNQFNLILNYFWYKIPENLNLLDNNTYFKF